jgi:tripeptidyl-peptidase I
MRLSFIAVAGLLTSVSFSLAASYAAHEKRQVEDPRWLPRDAILVRRTPFHISIGLKQKKIHKGHDFLMDVSDSTSPNYGNHWTPEQVRYERQKGEIETDNIGC